MISVFSILTIAQNKKEKIGIIGKQVSESKHWHSKWVWFHKRGDYPVDAYDSKGDYITNTEFRGRDYGDEGGKNYSNFCGYLCVPYGLDLDL